MALEILGSNDCLLEMLLGTILSSLKDAYNVKGGINNLWQVKCVANHIR